MDDLYQINGKTYIPIEDFEKLQTLNTAFSAELKNFTELNSELQSEIAKKDADIEKLEEWYNEATAGSSHNLRLSLKRANRIEQLGKTLQKAIQLCDIASDWNLSEVEIDEEMVDIYSLKEEFKQALKQKDE